MEKSLSEQLKNFDAVWQRVRASKSAGAMAARRGLTLMPQRERPSRSRRFPGR